MADFTGTFREPGITEHQIRSPVQERVYAFPTYQPPTPAPDVPRVWTTFGPGWWLDVGGCETGRCEDG